MNIIKDRFDRRCTIITGGASGLGKETARRMVAEGAKVALWDLNAETLQHAKQEVGAAHIATLDVTDPDQVAAAAAQSVKALGKVDILVNSAGITGATAMVHEYPIESWRRVIDINLSGLF